MYFLIVKCKYYYYILPMGNNHVFRNKRMFQVLRTKFILRKFRFYIMINVIFSILSVVDNKALGTRYQISWL